MFDQGVGIEIKASDGALSILLVVPDSFRNETKGLMGTWNGDDNDDFLTPDGITLSSNLTTEELHTQFGLLCKIILMILFILLLGPIAWNGSFDRFSIYYFSLIYIIYIYIYIYIYVYIYTVRIKIKVIHIQRPIVLKTIDLKICMWHISEEQLILFPYVPSLHQVCHAWLSTLPMKMTMSWPTFCKFS